MAYSRKERLEDKILEKRAWDENNGLNKPSSMSTTKQSPGSAPSTAMGPERLCILVRSTLLMSSLPDEQQTSHEFQKSSED